MRNNEWTIIQSDDYRTILYPMFCNSPEPKGSVVILHGMAEHRERYSEFAEYLNQNGYDVFTYNHRGHGTDKNWDELGFFAENKGYRTVILDAIQVLKHIQKHNRGKKLILFGHSMGSLIARNVIQYYDAVDAVIISGSTYPSVFHLFFGNLITKAIKFIYGPKHYSKQLDHLMFGGKRYTKINERTAFDWLTRNNPLVGSYIHDPFCGFICTTSFYSDLIKLAGNAASPNLIAHTRKNLPILMISGTQDPVGNYGKEITKLFLLHQKLHFEQVDCILYEECRHELLNELNRGEIMADICSWLNKALIK